MFINQEQGESDALIFFPSGYFSYISFYTKRMFYTHLLHVVLHNAFLATLSRIIKLLSPYSVSHYMTYDLQRGKNLILLTLSMLFCNLESYLLGPFRMHTRHDHGTVTVTESSAVYHWTVP